MDLYKILGLKRDADDSAIRDAYLKKAKSTHPDQGGDAAEFKEVARAYGVLGNPLKRISYDETGREDLALLASYEYEVDQQAYTNYGGAYAGMLGAQNAASTGSQ